MEQKHCSGCDEQEIKKVPGCPLQCRSDKCKAYQDKVKFNPHTKPIVWVLGGPGSGKLTQCQKIIAKYGFTHLSTGDLIREEVQSGSARAKCLTSIMNRGGLVPNDLMLDMLKEAMEKAAEQGTRGYIVDGYPREKSQGIEFEQTVGNVALILFFDASVETLTQRMCKRMATSNRMDDNVQTMKRRIQTFLKHNQAVLEPYRYRVAKINAEQPPELVFIEVQKAMDPIVEAAEAAEAALAEAAAIERAKAMAAYARSSTNLLGLSTLDLAQARASRTMVRASMTIGPTSKTLGRSSKANIKGGKAAAEAHAESSRPSQTKFAPVKPKPDN